MGNISFFYFDKRAKLPPNKNVLISLIRGLIKKHARDD